LRALVLVVAFVALLPSSLAAQGLGDAAARERARREAEPKEKPAKTFTDADLAGEQASRDEAVGAPAAEEGASSAADATPQDKELDALETERQERKLQEAEWRMRFANAREQVALAEASCWHEVVRTEFYQGVPVPMKVKEFVETEEFRRAKRALADLEEEFRRTGLPPGWAREP
jgi:hypothetical protein